MTTALMTADRRTGLIAVPTFSPGRSPAAAVILKNFVAARRHLLGSLAIRRRAEQALAELDDVRLEASSEGWDGYNAKPVSDHAYARARTFIQALPTTVPTPEIASDADGEISLEWVFASGLRFSVSVGDRGRLTFVSIIGNRVIAGTDWLDDGIPGTVLDALTSVASEARLSGLV